MRSRGRLVVCVLAAVMAVPVMARAGSAAADDPPVADVDCGNTACPPPPLLGTLDRGLTKATPAQVQSLRNLEADAVADVIRIHDLSASDTNAVLTWGRAEAQAQLFTRLLNAVKEDEDDRSDDQQNAVDWMSTMMHRKAAAAAVAAGREYVAWAGLDEYRFDALVTANASEGELREFLDDTPQPWNPPHYSAGYCEYRSPAPYGSEYTGYNHPTCFAPCTNFLGCNAPTPSYDQFVKWGEAAASYSLLNSEQFSRAVAKIGMAMGLAVAVGAAVAVGTLVPAALVGVAGTAAAIFPYAGVVSYTTGLAAAGFGAAALATVVGVVIVAVVIAVMQGMIVINAAQLPGQLAELIVDARTNAPDVDELIDSTEGMTTLTALFVLATLPEPRDEYCDNSSTIPENIKHHGVFVNLSWIPCLNATAIPEATPYDPQFLIKEDGGTTRTLSPTITFQDHAETTTTARLHDGWFILEPTGSHDEQTLTIEYLDWNWKKKRAWLLGDPDAGQVFVSVDVTNNLTEGLEDCLADGLCSESRSLEYRTPDGKRMSASVEQWKPSVGAPSYDRTPVEFSPTSYDANGFAPTGATGEVSYEWRFETAPCTKPCVILEGPLSPPTFGDPVSGAEVTHTWPYPGPFTVALTATDAEGRTATTSFEVQVQNVPPRILQLVPDCPQNAAGNPVPGPQCLSRTGSTATPRKLRGSFVDGRFDLRVNINWGDGTGVADCIPATEEEPNPPFPGCPDTPGNGLELKATGVGDDRFFEFEASHVYAEPGVYHGTMWVSDGVGASAEPFTMTIEDPTDVLVTTNTADGVVRIAETDATSHTIEVGLASQPSIDIIVAVTTDNRQAQVVDGVNISNASYTLLTFTPDNWDQPQAVTVRAVDDGFAEDDPHPTAVSVAVLRGEGRLSVDGQVGPSGRVLPVEIADNDQAGLVLSPTSLALTEGGPAATVTVGLSSTPKTGAVVDLTATTSGLCTVMPTSIAGIQDKAPRTLTVTPGRDHVPGDRDCTVHLVATSPVRVTPPPFVLPLPRDLDYDGLTADIAGPVTNVDIPGVTVTPTELALDTTAANPTATYEVVLDTMPTADVTISPTTSDPAITVSGPVTFTPENWDQPQTVTLTAPADAGPHTVVLNHEVSSGDATYHALGLGDVNVAVGDPATTITLTPNPDQPTTTKPTSVTATLTAAVGTPTGRVVFDGISLCEVGSLDCDTAIVDGVAQIDLGLLRRGTHTITATYPSDATHHAASATIDLIVTAGTPEPLDDTLTIAEDAGTTTVDVLDNDPAAEVLTITANTAADHGDVTCDESSCTYKPNADFHGTDSFTYTVTEGTNTATAIARITVDPVNDAPVAVDDTFTTAEDTATTIDVVGNDSDVDNDSLTVTGNTEAANGVVACDEASCTYTPHRDFHGVDTFTYTVSDGVDTATAIVTVTVDPVQDPPVAADDTATVAEDATIRIEVVDNDSDVDGDSLTVADHAAVADGEVDCDERSCTYTPNPNFHGTDRFTYTVSDGVDTATATVTVTVDPVNDPPVAVSDVYAAVEDTALEVAAVDGLLANDADIDDDALAAAVDAEPVHGALTLHDDGSFVYVPAADYFGQDAFTYRVSDADGAASPPATVSVTVSAATDIALTVTPNVSRRGQVVTLTATASAHGAAMTAGTVTFRDGATTLADDIAVDDQGQATFTTATLAEGSHRLAATYHPPAGFAPSTSGPVALVVDGAGPQANPAASPAANGAGWHRGPVTVRWNWSDPGAGIDAAGCRDRSTVDREGRHTVSATCRDLAGNQTTATRSVKVDSTSPTVGIASPTDGRYLQSDEVKADYTCQDRLSGVASCTGPVAGGAGLDTSTPGRHQFVVTARDRAGNASTLTVTYYVVERPVCAGRLATIVGTSGNDVITGTLGDDVIVTGAGRDWIRGRGGDDVICSGAQRDFVAAGDGDDTVDTGTGRDVASGGVGDDAITGRANADILTGGLGADTLHGNTGDDNLIGHDGDDQLDGGPGSDTCRGGAHTDEQTACELTLGVP
jgi:hypothetical protein